MNGASIPGCRVLLSLPCACRRNLRLRSAPQQPICHPNRSAQYESSRPQRQILPSSRPERSGVEGPPHFAVACSCLSFWCSPQSRHSGAARISVLSRCLTNCRRMPHISLLRCGKTTPQDSVAPHAPATTAHHIPAWGEAPCSSPPKTQRADDPTYPLLIFARTILQ
jgi:hypothetical protein